ncbi:MAG TPA: MGMT family protein [Bacteroidota bacterium]|nr:MGMT family protein [Bacteroidota bacterium]
MRRDSLGPSKALGPKGSYDAYFRIWETVSRVPRGKVSSYGSIARLSGLPRQARLAGYALHNLPPGMDIPWHRVINSAGRISLPGIRGETQARLLKREGVVFHQGKIDLKRFGWHTGHHRSARLRRA